jgi:hypothetical protein
MQTTASRLLLTSFLSALGLFPNSASAHDLYLEIPGDGHDTQGFDVFGLGDMDGDGTPDFIAGRHTHTEPGHGKGSARVLSGLDGSVIHEVFAPLGTWAFGRNVGGGFDINGDGRSEFMVADAIPDWVSGYQSRVIVYSSIDGSVIHDFMPVGNGLDYGESMGGAGDVNNDGVEDFFIVARDQTFVDPNGPIHSRAGVVYIYSGATGVELAAVWGTDSFGRFGRCAAPVGDFNGDGHDDLIATSAQSGDGYAKVISGADYSTLMTYNGYPDSRGFGWTMAVLGDVNGDSVTDFAFGDPTWDDLFDNGGRVHVISGSDGAELYSLEGDHDLANFGIQLQVIGDFDGDTYRDFAVALRVDEEMIDDGAAVHYFSGATGARLGASYGRDAVDKFGEAMADLGDVNQGGRADFLISASNYHSPAGYEGRLYIYTGLGDEPVYYCTRIPNTSGQPASIEVLGSRSLSGTDTSLRASNCPPNTFGIFFYGMARDNQLFGAGRLCVGTGTTGMFRLKPPHLTDAAGVYERTLDFSATPMSSGAGQLTPGMTANFQFWFRDTGGFNLSNAAAATFCF